MLSARRTLTLLLVLCLGHILLISSQVQSGRGQSALNSATLNFGAGSFSVDCWVRPAQAGPPSWQTIVDKLDRNISRGYTFGISNGNLALIIGDGTLYTHIGPAVNANVWNFAGVVVNRSANNVRFFLNGNAGSPQTLAASGSVNNGVALLIGAPYTPNVISETSIDELELFNRALGTNELADLWLADEGCTAGPPAVEVASLGPGQSG